MTESFNWLGRCARAAAFGIAALLLLTIARIVFFFAYKNDDLGFLSDFAPAMVMGLRVDAKWLAILLLPAWICVLPELPGVPSTQISSELDAQITL